MSRKTAKQKNVYSKPHLSEFKTGNREEMAAAQAVQSHNQSVLQCCNAEEKEKARELVQAVEAFNASFTQGKKLEKCQKLKARSKQKIEGIIQWFKDKGGFEVNSQFDPVNGFIVNVIPQQSRVLNHVLENMMTELVGSLQSLSTASEMLLHPQEPPAPLLLSSSLAQEESVRLSEPDEETGERFNLNFK